ncbi:iron-containing alcohol dehydrogenase [Salmonella enterica subsp. enterica]|nr:iron-containing alcohol dehydrogenase [Salmonella enterica subsp. enterica]
MGVKAKMIAVTCFSTGSEVTPFAVVTDDRNGQKYPLADCALTPDMAIVDANTVMDGTGGPYCAFGGLDAVTHAWKLTFPYWLGSRRSGSAGSETTAENLPASHTKGLKPGCARERVHSAATIAIIAFANANASSVYVTPWRTNWALSFTFARSGGNALYDL